MKPISTHVSNLKKMLENNKCKIETPALEKAVKEH